VAKGGKGTGRRAVRGDVISALAVAGLALGVSFLPPDTSLALIRESGSIRVCIPPSYPPLVLSGDPLGAGYDVDLLTEVARRLGVRVQFQTNPAITRDFNPRSWGITRAQCELVAGGVVASPTTRSFLDTSPAYLETGWAIVSPGPIASLDGLAVGFFAGLSGLDRLGLSRYLRDSGAAVSVVSSRDALIDGIASGRFAAGVTEALTARTIAGLVEEWTVAWMPDQLGRYPIAIGLWKGDLTLKRAIAAIIADLRRDGFLAGLDAKYDITAIEATFANAPTEP
jgi:polar amino acid transport system substrate-binding protein/cystine transport system substrate-binding protein/membrane-bound lytic murein transglycosylase F